MSGYDISTDGKTVYYLRNTEYNTTRYGTLYKWTYSKNDTESVKITSDVIAGSLSSFLKSGKINDSYFVFKKFSSVDAAGIVVFDLMSYNGNETTKLQSDLTTQGWTDEDAVAAPAAAPAKTS